MGAFQSKITQQHRKELKDGLKGLENQMIEKFRISSTNQQVLDQILRSQCDLQRLIKSMDGQHNQLKEDIISEIQGIREQQGEFQNQSRIHETKMEEEIVTQISAIHEKISQDQENKLLQSFTCLQTKLSQVDQRLTEMNTSFSDQQVSLEKSILLQLKESQEQLNDQTSKIIEEQVRTQFQKINEIFQQKILKVETDMNTQSTRLQTIEVSIKTLEQNTTSVQITKSLQKSINDIEKKFEEVQQKVNQNKENQELTTSKEITSLKQEMNELKTTITRLEKLIGSQNENLQNQINTIKNNQSTENEDQIKKQQLIKSNLNTSMSTFNSQLSSASDLKGETTPVGNKKNDNQAVQQKKEQEKQKIDALLKIQENFMKKQSSKVSIQSDDLEDDDKDSIESDNYPKKKKQIKKQKQQEKQQQSKIVEEKKGNLNNYFATPSIDLKQTFDSISLTSQQSLKEDSTPRPKKNFIPNQQNQNQKQQNNQAKNDKTSTYSQQKIKSNDDITPSNKDQKNYKKNFKVNQ